jgi:large subunit ribosomal protein L25
MKNLSLKATARSDKAKNVIKKKLIPAIFYGKNKKNQPLEVDYHDFRRVFEKSGYNTIIDLIIDDQETVPVLVYEVSLDPVKDTFAHIDFYALKMDQEITTEIPLILSGVSPAVKDLGGVLIHNRNEINVKCLPKNLIHEIEIDISCLSDFHSSISVGDIKLPKTITVLDPPETIIMTISAPRKSVEEEEAEAAVAQAAGSETAKEKEAAPAS